MNGALEACPGCGALFPAEPGATHPYIGASAGCWALYTAILARGTPPGTTLAPLLVDAYAAQHHGVPGPQAVQSVAVHLLTLYGVLACGVDPSNALWIRLRAVRQRGVFSWLEPPVIDTATRTPAHLVAGAHGPAIGIDDYVASTYASWAVAHEAQLAAWYAAWVVPDRLPTP